jgi:hypothetical protein
VGRDSVDRSVSIAKSFDEKGHQISVSTLDAFGIELTTRYNKCSEMIEMLCFAQGAAMCGGAPHIKSLFYDSKSNCCYIESHQKLDATADRELLEVAKQTITQFEWFDGLIYHGNGCGCDDCHEE